MEDLLQNMKKWYCWLISSLMFLSLSAHAADYTQGVAVSGSTATIWFKSTVSTTWVDVHYTVNGGAMQNLRMTYQSANARYEQPVTASSGAVLSYSFTYNNGTAAYDTPAFSYTVGSTPPPPPPTNPVCFYDGVNYGGASLCSTTSSSYVGATWNDRISSVKIAAGYQVVLYEHANQGGRSQILVGNSANLGTVGFSDFASSFTVIAPTALNSGPVSATALFKDTGIKFTSGQTVTVKASGTWQHSTGTFGPSGNPGLLINNCNVGQLVGRIGLFGKLQCLSANTSFAADQTGSLFLWQNDRNAGSGGSLTAEVVGGTRVASALPMPLLADRQTFATKCGVPFSVVNEDPAGGAIFASAIPDTGAWFYDIATRVCGHLYKQVQEPKAVSSLTLYIGNCTGVAYAWGDSAGNGFVRICGSYLQSLPQDNTRIALEMSGVMTHETTHIFQYTDPDGGTPSWLIEGIADAVRLSSGNVAPAYISKGGSYTDAYNRTAFFLVWLGTKYPDFLYRLNQTMKADGVAWTTGQFQTLTGKSIDTLWTEYQAAIANL
jgi:hypothetical protein